MDELDDPTDPGVVDIGSAADEIVRLNGEAVPLILAARDETDPAQQRRLLELAEDLLRKARQLDDTHPVTCTNAGALFCDIGAMGSEGGRAGKHAAGWARDVLSKAIDRGSRDANTLFNMAVAWIRLGEPEKAGEFLSRADELDIDSRTVAAQIDVELIAASRERFRDAEAMQQPEQSTFRSEPVPNHGEVPADVAGIVSWLLEFCDDPKPIVGLVDRVILMGQKLSACDVVIEPDADGVRIGVVKDDDSWFPDAWKFEPELSRPVVSRLMILSGQDIMRWGTAQTSEYALETSLGPVVLDVSTEPAEHGVKVVLRYKGEASSAR